MDFNIWGVFPIPSNKPLVSALKMVRSIFPPSFKWLIPKFPIIFPPDKLSKNGLGIVTGRFLEKGIHLNQVTGRFFEPNDLLPGRRGQGSHWKFDGFGWSDDFRISAGGNVVQVYNHELLILDMDEYSRKAGVVFWLTWIGLGMIHLRSGYLGMIPIPTGYRKKPSDRLAGGEMMGIEALKHRFDGDTITYYI